MRLLNEKGSSLNWRGLIVGVGLVVALVVGLGRGQTVAASAAVVAPVQNPEFRNPLTLVDPVTGPGVSCPDPAIAKEKVGTRDVWYLFCTGDPLNANDKDANGNLRNHYIATWRSMDLIHWVYNGDVFPADPAWIGVETNLWAPAVKFFNGLWHVYYVAPATTAGGSEIGVATSGHLAGPWKDLGRPVVPTEAAPCCANSNRAVIDPDVVTDDAGQRYISFGSFFGGISIQKLSADGFTADKSSEVQIAIDNLYEGGAFWKHDGWWYLFVSSTNCCNGPLSGYSVDVGRARTPLGPFLDKEGVALTTFAAGGTKAIAANGNRWVGPGGNVVFTDDSGQDYMLYHAIDVNAPYFDGYPGFTRRPALIDALDWVDGWPTVRNGQWASDKKIAGPVAQTFQQSLRFDAPKVDDEPGELIAALSDEFNSPTLSKQWHFIHPQANNAYTLTGSAYQVVTQGPDENGNPNLVSILGEPVPVTGDWMVETKMTTGVPWDNSCCYNYAQGALFIYGDDGNSVKLDVFPNFDVRETEFAKQVNPVPANYPTYGGARVGDAGQTTWMRIVKHANGDAGELYTAYTSADGYNWQRGTTWQHQLGSSAQIGISAENAAGFTMTFDYVRVYRLKKD